MIWMRQESRLYFLVEPRVIDSWYVEPLEPTLKMAEPYDLQRGQNRRMDKWKNFQWQTDSRHSDATELPWRRCFVRR